MSKIIYLTQGYQTTVDNDDYELLIKFKWIASQGAGNRVYARRGITINDRYFNIYMHRQIMGLTPLSSRKIVVDHIDNNGLNNRKENLRSVTHKQNMRNPNNKNHKREKVGVTQCRDKWRARITIDGKSIHLGLFIDEKDAIEAREKAEKLFDEYNNEQALRDCLVYKDDIYYDKEMKQKRGNKSRARILKYISQYIGDHGYPPSMRDIGDELGMGASVVKYHLSRMEQDGLIERDAGIARSIRVVQ